MLGEARARLDSALDSLEGGSDERRDRRTRVGRAATPRVRGGEPRGSAAGLSAFRKPLSTGEPPWTRAGGGKRDVRSPSGRIAGKAV